MTRDHCKSSLPEDALPLVTGWWAGPGVLRMGVGET